MKFLKKKQKDNPNKENYIDGKISSSYKENLENFKNYFKESSDLVVREFVLGFSEIKCAIIYIDGFIDKIVVHEHILNPLMQGAEQLEKSISKSNSYDKVKNHILTTAEIKELSDINDILYHIMSGDTALIINDNNKAIIINTRGWQSRAIAEPEAETVVRGPREGFVENLKTNIVLIRRRCRDINLVVKNMKVGRRSQTDVAIIYIKDIANPKIIEEVEKRVSQIDIDFISAAGMVEGFIQDSTWSLFPQVQSTERPDKVNSAIMEGRVAIVLDGTPFVLIVPVVLSQFLQTPEDYTEKWQIGTLLRFIRWFAVFITVFAPGLYLATVNFHTGMLPTLLSLTVANSRENLPFPTIIEILLMETTIEFLREAGARLPRPIGQTIGIVGGIIIGDAAVKAGIASPSLIVVVSITAIASFIMPSYNIAIAFRVIRFPILFIAAVLGLYGVILGFIIIVIHLANLKSFGVNYNAPFMPIIVGDFDDTIIHAPIKYSNKRPQMLEPLDLYRQPKHNNRDPKKGE